MSSARFRTTRWFGRRGRPVSVRPAFSIAAAALVGALTLAACALPPAPGAPAADQVVPPGGASNRVIVWVKCADVVNLTDADLDRWASWGIGGFVCKLNYLYSLGGQFNFTPNPDVPPTDPAFDLQRTFRDTQLVSRAAARGIKLWLGIGMGNYWNDTTPWSEWFDDAGWATKVLPNIRNLAGGARAMGFAGLAFDEELYGKPSGPLPPWRWDYPGNTRSEPEVRAQVARGARS